MKRYFLLFLLFFACSSFSLNDFEKAIQDCTDEFVILESFKDKDWMYLSGHDDLTTLVGVDKPTQKCILKNLDIPEEIFNNIFYLKNEKNQVYIDSWSNISIAWGAGSFNGLDIILVLDGEIYQEFINLLD